MDDIAYLKVADTLRQTPQGFPATDSGIEIKILKKIFAPEEADLFVDLEPFFETPDRIAQRTGRPIRGLEEKLTAMWQRGELESEHGARGRVFKRIPWVVGLYELQLRRMDKEFAELCHEYMPLFGAQFSTFPPAVFQTIPIERTLPVNHQTLPFERASEIVRRGKSFMVVDCICRKEKRLLGKGCDKPLEVCLSIGFQPNQFDGHPLQGKILTRAEALHVLQISEEAGLIHNTYNVQSGAWFLCNCCGCCCSLTKAVRRHALTTAIHSSFFAVINPEICQGCGLCASERCQVDAIEPQGDIFQVRIEKCLGCGVCVTTCPNQAIELKPRPRENLIPVPEDDQAWHEAKARTRAAVFSSKA